MIRRVAMMSDDPQTYMSFTVGFTHATLRGVRQLLSTNEIGPVVNLAEELLQSNALSAVPQRSAEK